MELTNLCPYCGQEMRRGVICALQSEKASACWYPCLGEGNTTIESERVLLSCPESLFSPEKMAQTYRCEHCGVLIVREPDAEEMKHPFTRAVEKLGQKLDRWSTEQETRREQRRAEKEQEEKEKAREARGKKDPWEI